MKSSPKDTFGTCSRPASRRSDAGYTIIEVLIAMSIFAVGLLAVATMQISAIRVNSTARDITERITIAQDKIEKLVAMPYDSPWLESAGNPPSGVDSAGNAHSETSGDYTVSWTTAQGPTSDANTILITVAVTKGGATSRVSYVKAEVAD